ncbi:carbohydrate ABC transporter permease, partial [Demequina sp. TTPB684]|nr:carbohydrate ABC transporter permease [Demequina sp. TTPB684]
MSVVMPPAGPEATPKPKSARRKTRAGQAKENLTSPWATAAAIIIAMLWTIPTVALFMTALIPGDRYRTDAWWEVLADGDLTFSNFNHVLFQSFGDNSTAPP